jgi:hypothetical protein
MSDLKLSNERIQEVCAYFPASTDYSGAQVDVEAFKQGVIALAAELSAKSVLTNLGPEGGRNGECPIYIKTTLSTISCATYRIECAQCK